MNSKSTYFIIFYCSLTLCSWIIITQAYPADSQHLSLDSFESSSNEFLQDNSNSNEQETLVRNKRTIGFLRQLFPGLSQIIDRKIQQITRVIFRVVGRLILRGGGGGAAGGAGGSDSSSGGDGKGGRRVSITLPTYPPFEDEEDEDNTDAPTSEKDTASSDQSTVRVNVSSTTASPNTDAPITTNAPGSNSSTPFADGNLVTEAQDSNTIRRINRDVSDVLGDTTLSVSSDETSSTTEAPKKSTGILSRLREMRNKRGLFRFGNSGGGSGNFLFDLIRLIAGSGTSPEKDEEQNAPRDEREGDSIDANDVNGSSSSYNDDSYTAGIPGPLTRLFILANRGISNLIQDLILLCPGPAAQCERNMTVIVNKVAENIHKSSPPLT